MIHKLEQRSHAFYFNIQHKETYDEKQKRQKQEQMNV